VKVVGFVALAACAIALPASAQGLGGLTDPQTYLRGSYVELEGGSPFQGATTEYNNLPGSASNKGSGHFQAGYFGGAIFGHKLAPGLSVELEGVYLKNRYDVATEVSQQVAGHSETWGGLANLKFELPYDYHVTPRFALAPYVAAGAGYGETDYKTGNNGATILDDGQSGLIWQAKAGLEVKTGTPVSFDIGYRYMGTPDYHQDFAGPGGTSSFMLKSHMQAATAGIKYTF
jgi:opacity protein-like surface antigen